MHPKHALFVGTPDRWEDMVLISLQQQLPIQLVEHTVTVYQHFARNIPVLVMFSVNRQDTPTLRLFRRLRRIDGICVAVCHQQTIQVFFGKGYPHRAWFPKNSAGAIGLLKWQEHVRYLVNDQQQRKVPPLMLVPPAHPQPSMPSTLAIPASLRGWADRMVQFSRFNFAFSTSTSRANWKQQ